MYNQWAGFLNYSLLRIKHYNVNIKVAQYLMFTNRLKLHRFENGSVFACFQLFKAEQFAYY